MKKIIRKKVLITGVGGPAGINFSKLFRKYKKYFYTYGLDINSDSAGQFFVDKFSICEKVSNEKKYLDYMFDFVKKNKINILIPTVAEELVLMQKLKINLEKEKIKCEIIVSENNVLELCDKKDKLYKWMDENFPEYMGGWFGLGDVPRGEKGEAFFTSENYFIKPAKGRGSRGCRLIQKDELVWQINNRDMGEYLGMEVLPGREWTVDCYVNDDSTFAYIVPRLRLGLSGGITSLGQTDRNEVVIKQTRDVFEKLGELGKIRGPVFIQWKEDKNGRIKMVEINPRGSGGLAITVLSGADPVLCLKNEIFGPKNSINIKWKEIKVTRYFEEKIIK